MPTGWFFDWIIRGGIAVYSSSTKPIGLFDGSALGVCNIGSNVKRLSQRCTRAGELVRLSQ